MTDSDKLFLKEYRKENELLLEKDRPPCLKCPDSLIIACSKLESSGNVGCVRFKHYVLFIKEN